MNYSLASMILSVILIAVCCFGCTESEKQPSRSKELKNSPVNRSADLPPTPTSENVPISEALTYVNLGVDIPENYSQTTGIRIIGAPDGVQGFHAIFNDPNTNESIHIVNEYGFDRRPNNARRGAAKAYLNATIKNYSENGFALDRDVLNEIKTTIDEFDFANGMTQTLPFENKEGLKIYVRLRILFTEKAVCITTSSLDRQRFEDMNRIADGISIK